MYLIMLVRQKQKIQSDHLISEKHMQVTDNNSTLVFQELRGPSVSSGCFLQLTATYQYALSTFVKIRPDPKGLMLSILFFFFLELEMLIIHA